MATARVLALQARLDGARDIRTAELEKQAPRDNVLAAIKEQITELHEKLKMLIAPAGKSYVNFMSACHLQFMQCA